LRAIVPIVGPKPRRFSPAIAALGVGLILVCHWLMLVLFALARDASGPTRTCTYGQNCESPYHWTLLSPLLFLPELFLLIAALITLQKRRTRTWRRWLYVLAGSFVCLGMLALLLMAIPSLIESLPYGRAVFGA
jgi:hypothetical protein